MGSSKVVYLEPLSAGASCKGIANDGTIGIGTTEVNDQIAELFCLLVRKAALGEIDMVYMVECRLGLIA